MLTTDIDGPAVTRVLERARKLRIFAGKYDGLGPVRSAEELERIPSMDLEDHNAALAELRALSISEAKPSYIFASGGTIATPKLSLMPSGMFVEDIVGEWAPLTRRDVLANLYTPGRMWSAHYFYNALGERLAGLVFAFGPVQADEFDTWLEFFVRHGVTALAATPTTIRDIARFCQDQRRHLPDLRALLWVGEPFGADVERLVADVMPHAETWGLYGSTETWVIGHNSPGCAL